MNASLSDAMFLCPGMAKVISSIRREHQPTFEFAEALNVFANHQIFSAEIKKWDLQQVLVSSLLPRLLTAFQGSVIVAERGLSAEAKLLARKVLEVTFRVTAIARSRDVADEYLRSDETNRLKFLNKLRLLQSVKHTPEEIAKIDELHAEVSATIVAKGIKEKSIYWYAEKAGLLDYYNTAYALLSESAHANIRDLYPLLETDADGDIEALRYGPDAEVGDILCIGIESVILALEAAFSLLANGDSTSLESMRTKMLSLFQHLEEKSET